MKTRNVSKLFSTVLLTSAATVAYGFDIDPALLISGFGSAGFSMTNATNVDFYDPIFKQKISTVPTIAGVGKDPIFNQDTLAGLQFVGSVNDQISFTAQFVSQGSTDYSVATDWLYAEWRINDEWDIKVGRIIMPLYMHSPYLKVNYAYLWSRLPIEFYNLSLSDFDGVTVRHTFSLWGNWKNDTTLSLGNTKGVDLLLTPPLTFDVKKGLNVEFAVYNENARVRADFSRGDATLNLPAQVEQLQLGLENPCTLFNTELVPSEIALTPGAQPGTCHITSINSPLPFSSATQGNVVPDGIAAQMLTTKNIPINLYSLGYEFTWHHFISIAEWNTIHVDDKYIQSSEAWYILLGYNWENITPHITYSSYRTTNNSSRVLENTPAANYVNPFSYFGPLTPVPTPESFQTSVNKFLALNNNAQHTIDVGIRYDIGSSTALKFDYRYVVPSEGTAGFFDVPPGKRISWVTAVIAVVF